MNRAGSFRIAVLTVALVGTVLSAAAGPAEALFEGAWDWRLPPRKFGRLSQAERAHYTRAETLVKEGQYEAAALEFEKFVTTYPKTDAYGHAILLQGYAYHLARFRNKAIERYSEVLDFFGDAVDEAVPAGFLKGMALVENGNAEQGYAVLQQVTDKDVNLESPVADLALNRLADRYLAVNEPKKAERCWLRVVDAYKTAFYGRPDAAAVAARQKLTDLYMVQGTFSSVDELYAKFPLEGKKPADTINYIADRGMAVFDAIPPKPRKAFFDWLRARKTEYEADGREGERYNRLLILSVRAGFRDESGKIAEEAVVFFKARTDKNAMASAANWLVSRLSEANAAGFKAAGVWKSFGESLYAQCDKLDGPGQLLVANSALNGFPRAISGTEGETVWNAMIARCRDQYVKLMNPEKDEGLSSLVDRLRNARQFDRALELVRRIENPGLALWKEIEVLGAQEKFAEQAAKCEELEKMDDKTFSLRALRHRAYLYKDRLAKYEDAIKLYAMINDPPGTIWATSECYQRLRKPDSAINSLTEIESFFERDAPRAALQKAYVWEQAGDKAKTVAALRAVLKKYPKDSTASTAHQMLERYGVATGGGVIDE